MCWDLQFFPHLLIPDTPLHIITMEPISLGHILHGVPGQTVDQKAVALEDLINLLIHLRHLFPVPEDLPRGIKRLQGIAAHLKESIPSILLPEPGADLARSGVHPKRCVRQDFPFPVDRHSRPTHPIHADAFHIRRRDMLSIQQRSDGLVYSRPPVFRRLFRPPRLRMINRILTCTRSHYRSVLLEKSNFTGTCPHVNSQ